MTDTPRLIEFAFPLKQASLDSVHEKNVRHGHISTLHIWPARRPLAACRAALIATLLPDPSAQPKPEGMSDAEWQKEIQRRRQELCEKIGGKVVKRIERKKMPGGQVVEREKEETEGGILHWGRETENAETLEWFRQEIRKAYGGRAPKVLDPFAGGGSIPLEAMRLGCEATAVDINPVAWFILKCTLEYPQKLAGQKRPLPAFIVKNRPFMEAFFKAQGLSKREIASALSKLDAISSEPKLLFDLFPEEAIESTKIGNKKTSATSVPSVASLLDADLAWHVRAWGQWVLERARRELARFYPVYADFEPVNKKNAKPYEPRPMQLVPLKDDGTADIDALNAEFTDDYLSVKANPRWIAKPTVAYLWARTVTCKNCRATIPLLKTRWLCKKDRKRVLLTLATESTEDREKCHLILPSVNSVSSVAKVVFGIETNVPVKGGNAAQRREHDKRIGAGTMSRAGAKCPCCNTIMTMEDIRLEGKAGRLGSTMTAVVVDGQKGKEYRLPTEHELAVATPSEEQVQAAFKDVPFGVPDEPTPAGGGSGAGRAFSVQGYGLMKWRDLFTPRQLMALGTFVAASRAARDAMAGRQTQGGAGGGAGGAGVPGCHSQQTSAEACPTQAYPPEWIEALGAYLALGVDKLADRSSAMCRWDQQYTKISSSFTRFALPMLWDYCEGNAFGDTTGNWLSCLEWLARNFEHIALASKAAPTPTTCNRSATTNLSECIDAILTDPPYYDAIPYSDLMDFFYIWLRRSLHGLSEPIDAHYADHLSPKWNHETNDGELIDDSSRHECNAAKSKAIYEDGMARVFLRCSESLNESARLIIVFANKQPDAWETLVAAIIRAGFVVDGSWPIETEMGNRSRAHSSAALASSVWLVCKKRPGTARPGWDNKVLEEMRANIGQRLRDFWDAGIRGPDFVWAATGPALEAYSKHPVVKKADRPGEILTVSEFLNHVRRIVVDFVVGRVLQGEGEPGTEACPTGTEAWATDRLDEPTAYYLLHRNDFGLDEAPVGACILYATACGLSDQELVRDWDLLVKIGGSSGISGTGVPAGEAEEEELGDTGTEAGATDQAGATDEEEAIDEEGEQSGSGGKVKLKAWNQRRGRSLGYEAPGGRPVPLIDRIHRLMHLWKGGDVHKVDEYLDEHGLRRHELFRRVLQSLIELAKPGSEERSLLESLSNHIGTKGAKKKDPQRSFTFDGEDV